MGYSEISLANNIHSDKDINVSKGTQHYWDANELNAVGETDVDNVYRDIFGDALSMLGCSKPCGN